MKRRLWLRVALLFLVPVLPMWWLAAKRSWLPRELPVMEKAGSDGQIESLLWSPDGRTLLVGVKREGREGQVQFWDARSRRLTGNINTDAVMVSCSESGRTLVGWSPDAVGGHRAVTMWRLAQSSSPRALTQRDVRIAEPNEKLSDVWVWFAGKGESNLVMAGESSRTVTFKRLNLERGTLETVHRFKANHDPSPEAYLWWDAWSDEHGGSLWLVREQNTVVRAWKTSGKNVRALWRVVARPGEFVDCVNLFDKAKRWAWVVRSAPLASSGRIEVRDARTGAIAWSVTDSEDVLAVDVSPDQRLMVQDRGRDLLLRDARTGRALRTLRRPAGIQESEFATWDFSPDSSTLAAANADGTVTLWRVR